MSNQEIDALIYESFPRKVGRLAALKSIEKAVRYIVNHDCITPIEARRRLYKATKAFADSPAGKNPNKSFIPHCSSWMNRGSFMDDQSEWQLGIPKTAASLGVYDASHDDGRTYGCRNEMHETCNQSWCECKCHKGGI